MPPAAPAAVAEVQGNVLDPYRLPCVRNLVLRVADAGLARRSLSALLDPAAAGPTITSGADPDAPKPGPFLNVGFTFAGLAALGVPEASLRTFPPEFRAGMAARAVRLGDVGASAPEAWVESLRPPAPVHLVFTVHAETAAATATAAHGFLAAAQGGFVELGHFDGQALVERGDGGYGLYHDVAAIAGNGDPYTRARGEHFGFRDGFSHPRFAGIGPARSPREPLEPLGIVLLGHPSTTPAKVCVPEPHVLGHQGSFNAFRVLAQDVAGFRRYVAEAAGALGIDGEELKAKVCGRWPNGVPLSLAATAADARTQRAAGCDLNDFDFTEDQDGATCPVGSHIRRSNPRAAQIVQRPANRSRRLVRRGMPFGPWLEQEGQQRSTRERGLLGNFLCASLSTQFEAMQYDWLNLGLQDPSITSTNDPLVGNNHPATGSFTFSTAEGRMCTVRNLPRFVETMGGAYCFLPSMAAFRWLAVAGWASS